MSLSEPQQKVLKNYLASGEKIRQTATGENLVLGVTDRRIVEIEEWQENSIDKRQVRSTFFTGDRVIGTTVDHKGSKSYDENDLAAGGLIGAIGLIGLSWGWLENETFILIIAAIVAIIGVMFIWSALGKDEGEVTVTIKTTEGDDKELQLQQGSEEIAQAISGSVGNAHGPN